MNPSTQLTFEDITQSIDDWALDYGILPEIIIARLERGESIEAAITKPMVVARGQKLPKSFVPPAMHRASKPAPERRRHKRYEHDGKNLTVTQWSELTGVGRRTIEYRLEHGWTIEQAISVQPGAERAPGEGQAKRYEHDGKNLTIREWAELTGISRNAIKSRLRRGLSIEQAINFQPKPAPKPAPRERQVKRYEHDGRNLTLNEWSELTGISRSTIKYRLKKGLSIEQAIIVRPKPAPKPAPVKRRRTKRYAHADKNLTLPEWSELTGIAKSTINARLERGWSFEQAIGVQPKPSRAPKFNLGAHKAANAKRYEHNGKNLTVPEWSKLTGINTHTINYRLRRGLSFEQAIGIKTMPLGPNSLRRLRTRQSFDRLVKRLRASKRRLAA